MKQLQESVVARLVERGAVPTDTVPEHVREFSEDLLEVLVVERADAVELLLDDDVERLGGHDAAREQGLRNLVRVVPELEVHHLGNEEVGVTLVTSDSTLSASTVLLLADVLAHAELGAAPDGAFVATPNHTELLVHPLRDARSWPSLQVLGQMTRAGFVQSEAPLSPHVHWWDGTSFTQVTVVEGDDMRFELGPELQTTLERLAR